MCLILPWLQSCPSEKSSRHWSSERWSDLSWSDKSLRYVQLISEKMVKFELCWKLGGVWKFHTWATTLVHKFQDSLPGHETRDTRGDPHPGLNHSPLRCIVSLHKNKTLFTLKHDHVLRPDEITDTIIEMTDGHRNPLNPQFKFSKFSRIFFFPQPHLLKCCGWVCGRVMCWRVESSTHNVASCHWTWSKDTDTKTRDWSGDDDQE